MTATRQVRCKDVLIGGGAPCSIQSMTNVDSRDEADLPAQGRRMPDRKDRHSRYGICADLCAGEEKDLHAAGSGHSFRL